VFCGIEVGARARKKLMRSYSFYPWIDIGRENQDNKRLKRK